ncbi:TPA: hypothetical protein N0F65_011103, partial [Lagenidium giganteum]
PRSRSRAKQAAPVARSFPLCACVQRTTQPAIMYNSPPPPGAPINARMRSPSAPSAPAFEDPSIAHLQGLAQSMPSYPHVPYATSVPAAPQQGFVPAIPIATPMGSSDPRAQAQAQAQAPAPPLKAMHLMGGSGPITAAPMPHVRPGPPTLPASTLELRMRCKNLKKSDLLSESDPFVVVYLQEGAGPWFELGRTETITNCANPAFVKAMQLDFFFEDVQRLRFEVFDRDSVSENLREHDFLGCVEFTVAQLMSAPGQAKTLALLQQRERGHVSGLTGSITVLAEEMSSCGDMMNIQFAADKVDNTDGWFSASDPFLNVFRLIANGADTNVPTNWIRVWQTEVIRNNLNPRWRLATLGVQQLCNGDRNRPLKLVCMDWEDSGRHQFIGECFTTASELMSGEKTSFNLINPERQRKKGKKYVNSGLLRVVRCETFRKHTFAEYLRGGLEISLMVGIDYTQSNGNPSDPSSLHFLHSGFNDYQAAIGATGAILEEYDQDKRFPVYGFGGWVNGDVNHCFSLTFDPTHPEVEGVDGILQAYTNSFNIVQLYGPTHFAPLIRQAISITRHFTAMEPNSQKYFVLLIITDGVIMDMQQTIDAIVEASFLPMSIVIVGVGNADFSAMNALDSDNRLLMDSRQRSALRDIVQFVPFNQFRSHPQRLAKETLAEIPEQVVGFFTNCKIKPLPPLQRPSSEWSLGPNAHAPPASPRKAAPAGAPYGKESLA